MTIALSGGGSREKSSQTGHPGLNSLVPQSRLTAIPTTVQVPTHMLGVRTAGGRTLRCDQRLEPCCAAAVAVQAME